MGLVGVVGEKKMVLKKSPKRWQTIWFTEEEEIRLKSFVSHDIKTEIALNSTCSEAVNMVLEDDNLRQRLVGRIDDKVKQSWEPLLCAWCNFASKTKKGAEIHMANCKKRPLEVLISN